MLSNIFHFKHFQYNTTAAPVENKFLNLKNSLNNNQNLLDLQIPVNRQGNLMSAEDILTEHYARFKPVLEELKYHAEIIDTNKLLIEPSLVKLNVIEHKISTAKSLECILFSTTNPNIKQEYLELIFPNFRQSGRSAIFRTLLNKLGEDNVVRRKVAEFEAFLRDFTNKDYVANIFQNSKQYKFRLEEMPEIDAIINRLSDKFQRLSDMELEFLLRFVEDFERFSLITMEPYLMTGLSVGLFFKLFIPAHQQRNFKFLIKKTIDVTLKNRSYFWRFGQYPIIFKIKHTFTTIPFKIKYTYNTIPYKKELFFLGTSGFFARSLYSYYSYTNSKNLTNIATLVTKNLLEQAKNLETPLLKAITHNLKVLGYSITRIGSSFYEGVLLGTISKNEHILKEAAKQIEQYLKKKK